MSRVRVESAMKIKDMSRIRVESRWSSFVSELSQLDIVWVKAESLIFLQTKREYFLFICGVAGKEPTNNYIRPHQLLAKFGKMWRVVSQIWLNSEWNELSLSWVRLTNLEFELSRSCQSRKVNCWVESELNHLDCHMSQSRVSPKNLSRAHPWLVGYRQVRVEYMEITVPLLVARRELSVMRGIGEWFCVRASSHAYRLKRLDSGYCKVSVYYIASGTFV